MLRKIIILILFTLGVTIISCKKESHPPQQETKAAVTPVGTVDGNAVTQTIGAGGGSLISGDSVMELVIPSGALAANTAITIQPITNSAPNGRGKAYRCLPDGLKFNKDITVKFHYSDEDAAATKPEYMMIAFQTTDRNWQVIEHVNNDVAANTVSASVNHFTDFTGFDVMRISPSSLYLKPGQQGEYELSATGMSELNRVLLLTELLNRPETWKANGVTGGNSNVGTIAPNSGNTKGVYTAPAAAPAINPVIISAELNFPFVVDGQRFNQGILTANAYIIGGRYAVDIEASLEVGLGTLEKFRMRDHCRFTVNLTGISGTVDDIQNSPATFEKTQESPVGCVSTWEVSGTGILHIRPQDVLYVMASPVGGEVSISFGMGGGFVNPQLRTSCPGNTPAVNELPLAGNYVHNVTFIDSGQQQVKSEGGSQYLITTTIKPLN